MNTIYHQLPSGDLASRKLAIAQRKLIESDIASRGCVVMLDLSNVESISESYADELFGVLVLKNGLDHVLQQLKLINSNPYVLKSVASVMKRRSHERNTTCIAC